MRVAYPAAARAATSYLLHGVQIADPYQWLEDPDSAETAAFVASQNELFEGTLNGDPNRQRLQDKISKTFYPRTSPPFPHGDRFYYSHNTGLENQNKILRCTDLTAPEKDEEIFFDPNTLSDDGTTAIRAAAWSKSDKYFAFAISEKGSDWCQIRVLGADKAPLAEQVDWVKFSGIAWLNDEGFFYVRFPPLREGQQKGKETDEAINGAVYFHAIGTDSAADVRVMDIPDQPKHMPQPTVSDCHKYLIISVSDGCEPKNLVWVAEIPSNFASKPCALDTCKLVNQWDGEYNYLGNDGSRLYFATTKDAPRKKIVAIEYPSAAVTELVAERDSVLNHVTIAKDKLLLSYLEHVKDVLYAFDIDGLTPTVAPTKIDIPVGTITSISSSRDTTFVSLKVTSFTLPGRSFTFDTTSLTNLTKFRDDVVEGLNPDDFETTQVFVPSKDGSVQIPMFIVKSRSIPQDKPNPTLLYGYGGFNISLTPSFSPSRLVFMKNLGGIFACANIRGGGEYGEEWHNGGRKASKFNCFTDFIECAKYLNAQPYCSPETLAIMGGSNGGLLVAACANIAPEQFGAVVAQVGVLDMYKFHKFTIGHAWRSDYGDPDVEGDFKVLQTYSPIHNVKEGVKYPPILVVTGDHDDRVVPLHSLKYVATLQSANPEVGGPFLARIETSAGHGAGKPTHKVIAESADTYAFLARYLGAKWHE